MLWSSKLGSRGRSCNGPISHLHCLHMNTLHWNQGPQHLIIGPPGVSCTPLEWPWLGSALAQHCLPSLHANSWNPHTSTCWPFCVPTSHLIHHIDFYWCSPVFHSTNCQVLSYAVCVGPHYCCLEQHPICCAPGVSSSQGPCHDLLPWRLDGLTGWQTWAQPLGWPLSHQVC